MKTIDAGLTDNMMHLLQNVVGSRFIKYRSDQFTFTNSAFERVGIYTDGITLVLKNSLYRSDYFGSEEDVCKLEIFEANEADIAPGLENAEQIDVPVNGLISEIHVVQERQRLFDDKNIEYDIYLTRGIIFIMDDGSEIAFEKTDPFIEIIAVSRGKNLISGFSSIENICEGFDESYKLVVERFVDILKAV